MNEEQEAYLARPVTILTDEGVTNATYGELVGIYDSLVIADAALRKWGGDGGPGYDFAVMSVKEAIREMETAFPGVTNLELFDD